MVGNLAIRPSHLIQSKLPELEKEEESKKNILFLLLVLIGVNGSDLLEKGVQSASDKVEVLKTRLEQKQKQIERLNEQLSGISKQYDQLNEKGKQLEDLSDSERQMYFIKSKKLQDTFELAQIRVKVEMKEASAMMQEVVRATKIDVEPFKKVIEAMQTMGKNLVKAFNELHGNDIRFK